MSQFYIIIKIFFKKNFFFDLKSFKKIQLIFFLFFITSILELFSIGFLILVVLTVLGHTSHFPEYFQFLQDFDKQNLLLLLIFFIFTKYFLQICLSIFEKKNFRDLQVSYTLKLVNSYFYTSNTYLSKTNYSNFLNNVINEVKNVFTGFFKSANEFFSEFIILLSIIFLLLYLVNFKIIIIFILTSIFLLVFLKIISKLANYWGEKKIKAGSELLSSITGILNSYKIIKLLKKENFFLKKLSPTFFILSHSDFIEDIGQKLFRIFLEAIVFLTFLIILYFLISEKQDELMMQIIQIFIPFMRIIPSFLKINTTLNKMLYALPSVLNLKSTSNELKKHEIKTIHPANEKKISFSKFLQVENLHFSYTDGKKILNNKSFIFEKNKKYLLTGKSGSGKTTFVELLLGFQKANQGGFKIDGIDFENTELPSWRKLFGYVPQEVNLLNETIASNIAFGVDLGDINYKKVQYLLNNLRLESDLKSDDIIKNFGSNISGGQKQRIGICRALYFDPEILILDEPTSALNEEDSNKIISDILSLQKTVIVISHDKNIVDYFKNIIDFE